VVWTNGPPALISLLKTLQESTMAHKKVERKKEIDRRRQRREQRLKARVKEAKAAAKK